MATVQEPIETRRGLVRAREAVAALAPRGEWVTARMVRDYLKRRDREACSQTDAIEACHEWRASVMSRPIVQTVAKAFQKMDPVELDKAQQLLRAELKLRALLKEKADRDAAKTKPVKGRRA